MPFSYAYAVLSFLLYIICVDFQYASLCAFYHGAGFYSFVYVRDISVTGKSQLQVCWWIVLHN